MGARLRRRVNVLARAQSLGHGTCGFRALFCVPAVVAARFAPESMTVTAQSSACEPTVQSMGSGVSRWRADGYTPSRPGHLADPSPTLRPR